MGAVSWVTPCHRRGRRRRRRTGDDAAAAAELPYGSHTSSALLRTLEQKWIHFFFFFFLGVVNQVGLMQCNTSSSMWCFALFVWLISECFKFFWVTVYPCNVFPFLHIYMMDMEREGCHFFLLHVLQLPIIFLFFRVCAVVEEESK